MRLVLRRRQGLLISIDMCYKIIPNSVALSLETGPGRRPATHTMATNCLGLRVVRGKTAWADAVERLAVVWRAVVGGHTNSPILVVSETNFSSVTSADPRRSETTRWSSLTISGRLFRPRVRRRTRSSRS
jgi:hypothetical protein